MIPRYHERNYVGCKENDGYTIHWNSADPDLEPTETFSLGYGNKFCVYCCSQSYPIQAGLRSGAYRDYNSERDYTITGYTCTCEGAESEKLLRQELEELKVKQQSEELELKNKYSKLLKHNKRKHLEMKHAYEMKELEREEKWYEESRSIR
ncbi:hypothetical protein [Paenibacillus sp. Marseille-Q4541]|uniref:hypothetical protein n=1 Tax=Paenibacillus sp. Marseille-Q4541 TaxID=2831522 RepID=UPI001BAA0559|nr:hypothetical protein [Paenibacillus sp. Marseille-Q4541]